MIFKKIKHFPQTKRIFFIAALCSCSLSLYLFFKYHTWKSVYALSLCSFTFILMNLAESYDDSIENNSKKEFYIYFTILSLGFHLTAFYHCAAEICYLDTNKKDQLFVDFDKYFFKFWPQGQISIWLDQNKYLNPTTFLGKLLNTFFQIFYMIYFFIPVICVFGHPLIGTIKESIYIHKKGRKSENYEKVWSELYFMGSCFIFSFIPVIYGNVNMPAWSPRLFLKNEYKNELVFFQPIQLISIRKNESANSWPSGHISETSVFFYALHILGFKKLEIFIGICAFNIIWATMILRCHYFADVCISVVIAFFAFAISYFCGYRLEMKKFEENKKYENLNENGKLELGINNTILINNEEDKSKDN